jgi:hypothetical protein
VLFLSKYVEEKSPWLIKDMVVARKSSPMIKLGVVVEKNGPQTVELRLWDSAEYCEFLCNDLVPYLPVQGTGAAAEHPEQIDDPLLHETGSILDPVAPKSESVKFETLPLLAQFGVGEAREFYLKVGNSTAIHLTHSTVNYPARPLVVGQFGKVRFKKTFQVFPVFPVK